MNRALCLLDNTEYEAVTFSTVQDFVDKKRNLVCPECNRPAYYRGPTRNGREACFCARPHAEGCTMATQDHDGTATGQVDDDGEILTTAERIVVDFNQGTPEPGVTEQAETGRRAGGTGRRQLYAEVPMRDTLSRRMSSLLRTLIESEEFRRSNQLLVIPGAGEFPIVDFFVNFCDITDAHQGEYHGYWGMIPDARTDANGTLWFNSRGYDDISILLDQAHLDAVYQRFRIDDAEDIAGAYILVFGELTVARSGKRYIQITDPSRFTLKLARLYL